MATANKKAAPKASAKTDIAKWDEELAAMAEMAAGTEAAATLGNWLSVKQGIMSYQGNDIPGNKLECVIPAAVFENAYYDSAYDPDNPQSPVCFAFSENGQNMVPHEKSTKPQNEQCGEPGKAGCCPQNEWASTDVGRGKACKNIRRLAVIEASEASTVEGIETANAAFIKIPVTSVKGWSGYVQTLKNTIRRPPMAVITEMSCRPDPKRQVAVNFKFVEQIESSPLLHALKARVAPLLEALQQPYTSFEDEAEEAPAPKKKNNKKKF
jgi:hypothetical protein